MLPFGLEKSVPIVGDMPILVGLRMVIKGTSLVGFRIVRGDDFITSAANVLFRVCDHEILLYLAYLYVFNTPSK